VNFEEAHDYLDSLQFHKIKLGLDSMQSFLAKVERPEKGLKFVHIAGTNGKGSVSVSLVTILGRAGYKVGLFTSPHLSSVRERFRINDEYITEKKFADLATRVRQVLGEEKITYFEFTTALALLWFAEAGVDLVVLETGLGGRLDATNVIVPMVSVITNVSMDHEAYLGNDLQSVAFEKAGIIKKGVPLVSGAANDVTLEVVETRCREEQAPLYLYGRDFDSAVETGPVWSWSAINNDLGLENYSRLCCAMKGNYQRANSSLAIAVLQLLKKHGFSCTEEDIRKGISEVRWPGRLEYIVLGRNDRKEEVPGESADQIRYLIDGAHNPAGVDSLVTTLAEEYSFNRLVVVWGAMEDKDLALTVPAIGDMASTIILTQPEGERAAHPSQLLGVLSNDLRSRSHLITNVKEALLFAEQQADTGDLIVVAGSLYLIGEVRSFLVGELVQ
jgi:dihydrofolate synthase/folylpolyglutamate synthase